jgi:hypothetical protein
MEQIFEHLLAETRTSQEEMNAGCKKEDCQPGMDGG